MCYAGIDSTGTTDRNSQMPLYGPCIAAVRDIDELTISFSRLRHQFGMKAQDEFRGSKSTGDKLAAVLNAGLELGFCVGTLLIDKTKSPIIPSTNAQFVMLSIRRLLHEFLPLHLVRHVWCDDEDLSRDNKRRFKSDIARIAHGYGSTRLKTSICSSHHSDLIQLADVVAYSFSWDARKRSEPDVVKALNIIREDSRNVIIGPEKWRV